MPTARRLAYDPEEPPDLSGEITRKIKSLKNQELGYGAIRSNARALTHQCHE